MLSIIIPTKDRLEILSKTIESLLNAIEETDAEIIVVNDSKEELYFDLYPQIRVFNSRKSSAAIARNLGAKHSNGNILLFLDDDILIGKECLTSLYQKTLDSNNTIYLPNWKYPLKLNDNLAKTNFGRFVINSNYNSLKGYLNNNVYWNDEQAMKHNGVASYCLMLKKDYFNLINGYDEAFSFAGFEDHDISKKIAKLKTDIYIEPQLMVYHNEEDKLQILNWLQRMERGAVTRRQAVNIGYDELKLHYSRINIIMLTLIYKFRNLLLFLSSTIPNKLSFDKAYSLIFKTLIRSYIYKGYTYENKN